jgi:hypothetical protein
MVVGFGGTPWAVWLGALVSIEAGITKRAGRLGRDSRAGAAASWGTAGAVA